MRFGHLDSLVARIGGNRIIAEKLELFLDYVDRGGIIFNQENSLLAHCRSFAAS
jgi:hypothetical protein